MNRARITGGRAALVAGGGALGATLRWATGEVLPPTQGGVGWATLLVNVLGSALLGWALVESRRRPERESLLIDGVGTGICGGLTTFSALAVHTAGLGRSGDPGLALVEVALNVALGVTAATVAISMARRIRQVPP